MVTTTREIGYLPPDGATARERAAKALKIALYTVLSALQAKTRPARGHFRDHAYTWAGFGFISVASFLHSPFTGFLVTGILMLVFEWKAADRED